MKDTAVILTRQELYTLICCVETKLWEIDKFGVDNPYEMDHLRQLKEKLTQAEAELESSELD